MTCPKCNFQNEESAKFCRNCGANLSGIKNCPQCNYEGAEEALFCKNCGAAMDDEPMPSESEASAVSAREAGKADAGKKTKKSGKWLKRAIIAVTFLLAIAAAGHYFVFKDDAIFSGKAIMLPVEILSSDNRGDNRRVTFEYDDQDRITTINHGDQIERFRYDDYGNLIAINGTIFERSGNLVTSKSAGIYAIALELNAEGLPLNADRRYSSGFRSSIVYQYRNGNLSSVQTARNGSTGYGSTYTYDNKRPPFYYCQTPKWYLVEWWHYGVKNNILTMNQKRGPLAATHTYTYTYDNNGFPLTRKRTDSDGYELTETFTYKKLSNRTKKVDEMMKSAFDLLGIAQKDEPVQPTTGTRSSASTGITATVDSASSVANTAYHDKLAEEQAQREAEEEAARAAEQARLEEEARRRAEEQARLEAEARRKSEEEQARRDEAAVQAREEAQRQEQLRKQREEAQRQERERLQREQEQREAAQRKAEEDRRRREEAAKKAQQDAENKKRLQDAIDAIDKIRKR